MVKRGKTRVMGGQELERGSGLQEAQGGEEEKERPDNEAERTIEAAGEQRKGANDNVKEQMQHRSNSRNFRQ